MEIVRPEFLPVTLILISRYRERRSFRASFRAGMRTSGGNFTKDDGTAGRRQALVKPSVADQFSDAKLENTEVKLAVGRVLIPKNEVPIPAVLRVRFLSHA